MRRIKLPFNIDCPKLQQIKLSHVSLMKNDRVSKRKMNLSYFSWCIHTSFLSKHGTAPKCKREMKLNKWLCVLGIFIGGSFIKIESKRNKQMENIIKINNFGSFIHPMNHNALTVRRFDPKQWSKYVNNIFASNEWTCADCNYYFK